MRSALLALLLIAATFVDGGPGARAGDVKRTTAILVDKSTNTLKLTEYVDGVYQPLLTFHATMGKVKGDKDNEGDLKTPEGIYTFKAKLLPPSLKKKFGVMAFYMNYPNSYDEMAGRTGFDIMLHATDDPQRLVHNFDSEGCVVLKNEELVQVATKIRLGLTPILVFPEMPVDKLAEYMRPGVSGGGLKEFFESWIAGWESRDVDRYVSHYHSDFKGNGLDLAGWKAYKGNLTRQYATITVGPEDAKYYRHPKYSMITFTQNYRSKRKGGGWGHRSRGTKILYVAEEAGKPKIIAENYTTLMW